MTHDKTVIMIAHRLKTVRNADMIFVVDHGEIVQQGTMTIWWLLTGSTAASWWSGSRPPGGRSEETQSKKYKESSYQPLTDTRLLRLSLFPVIK